jgi:hypothetical protein
MTYFPLTPSQLEWQERTRAIATESIGPRADGYDRNFQFPGNWGAWEPTC